MKSGSDWTRDEHSSHSLSPRNDDLLVMSSVHIYGASSEYSMHAVTAYWIWNLELDHELETARLRGTTYIILIAVPVYHSYGSTKG
jgi:hypothetical protein